jgi:hypothetical protein
VLPTDLQDRRPDPGRSFDDHDRGEAQHLGSHRLPSVTTRPGLRLEHGASGGRQERGRASCYPFFPRLSFSKGPTRTNRICVVIPQEPYSAAPNRFLGEITQRIPGWSKTHTMRFRLAAAFISIPPVSLLAQQCTTPVGPSYYTNCSCGPSAVKVRAACYNKTVLGSNASCGTDCESCYVVCGKKPLPPPRAWQCAIARRRTLLCATTTTEC